MRIYLYIMFFLSGAAALMYQLVWVRSLSLIFGGSHLAVTAVLSIFMAGLAIGGYVIGRYADTEAKPLRLYGFLELGVAAFAFVFAGLMKLYPAVYPVLAEGKDGSPLFLTMIRLVFSIIALLGPTILMGGTLPVLSRFISQKGVGLKRELSFLYGFNTLGAVFGAAFAGFYLFRHFSVSSTLNIAIFLNIVVGILSILLQHKASLVHTGSGHKVDAGILLRQSEMQAQFPLKLVLWGAGVSGFCALGYEVLWTRILTLVVGANVYSFTVMLVAFLSGIALGSKAFGLLPKRLGLDSGEYRQIAWFGAVQIVIGVTALFVTVLLRDLPTLSVKLLQLFGKNSASSFDSRLWSNFFLAFLTMSVPAFFMGLAFPLAGTIHAAYKKRVGIAVGEILAYNTVGALLGAGVSGFVLIYLFGIERSLQILTLVNIGFGLLVLASLRSQPWLNAAVAGVFAGLILLLAASPDSFRFWNAKYFAVFRNNQMEHFSTPQKVRDALDNTDVLYYAEGAEAIVSSIKVKGGDQAFITNGRIEASTHPVGQLHLYTLGHLPMLLHKGPQNALVIGTGSGMTLGAVGLYPSIKQITLAEIEPKVLGVARTFSAYNHNALDNPKVKIVFNDGRNFLMTTKGRFDVITADPIHPWFRGAGYLYTTEYFKLVSERLAPGGIVCQWLPVYELTVADLKSVAKTFSENFKYTMMWLTHTDAELIGSNDPIVIDEAEIDNKIRRPEIFEDLKRVNMGSTADFLSYFIMGTAGVKAFSEGGIINTDDNLYLEFSAPLSIGREEVVTDDIDSIYRHRESILPYLKPVQARKERADQIKRWTANHRAMEITGRASALFVAGLYQTPEFDALAQKLDRDHAWFAPWRFLKNEYLSIMAMEPKLIQARTFMFHDSKGTKQAVQIAVVGSRLKNEMTVLDFVNSTERIVYGQLNVSGANRDKFIAQFASDTMTSLQHIYEEATAAAMEAGNPAPSAIPALQKMRNIIKERVQAASRRINAKDKEVH